MINVAILQTTMITGVKNSSKMLSNSFGPQCLTGVAERPAGGSTSPAPAARFEGQEEETARSCFYRLSHAALVL